VRLRWEACFSRWSDSGQLGLIVHAVASWLLVRIDPGGWDPVGKVVEHDRGPAHAFEQGVVGGADEGAVVDAGAFGLGVIRDVMSFELARV
jgi:hypothetical protein